MLEAKTLERGNDVPTGETLADVDGELLITSRQDGFVRMLVP